MSALIKYDQARQALAACRNVDDIKDIRDKSEAMRLYAKQANDTELEQWAAEIKLRAQRAIGELSAQLATQKGGFGIVPTGGKHKAEVLADAGISTSTANRYEKLAAIPEPEIEAFIAKSKEVGKPVSVKAVMATLAPKSMPTSAPAPSAPSLPEEPARADNAGEEVDLPGDDGDAIVEQLIDENRSLADKAAALAQEVAFLKQDDMAGQAAEWKLKFEQLAGRNRDLQEKARAAQTESKYRADLLAKIRSVLGVAADADILPAISARRAA